jgi:hypothetical protein
MGAALAKTHAIKLHPPDPAWSQNESFDGKSGVRTNIRNDLKWHNVP